MATGAVKSDAPSTVTSAPVITKTADSTLTNEFALSSLTDGILKHASGTPATATAGTDYVTPAGVSGGQTVKGDTASGGNLTLDSTAHATKGKIFLGANSAYNQSNDRLGINSTSPATNLDVRGGSTINGAFIASSVDNALTTVQVSAVSGNAGSITLNSYGNSRTSTVGQTDEAGSTKLNGTGPALNLVASDSSGVLRMFAGGSTDAKCGLTVDNNQNVIPGTAAVATNATNGFIYLGSCAGTPTGTPAATATGRTPVIWDSTNDKLYVYDGGWVIAGSGGTPAAHATSHQSGGSDAIKLDDLATPDDNTDLDVSTSHHGLAPKAPNDTTKFLRGDATWAVPSGGGVSNILTYPDYAPLIGTYQVAGRRYDASSFGTNANDAADLIYLYPYVVPYACSSFVLGVWCETGGGSSKIRMGAYSWTSSTDPSPGALIGVTGTAELDLSTSGFKTGTVSAALTAGQKIWIAGCFNNTSAVVAYNGAGSFAQVGGWSTITAASNVANIGYKKAHSYAALPDPITSASLLNGADNTHHVCFFIKGVP